MVSYQDNRNDLLKQNCLTADLSESESSDPKLKDKCNDCVNIDNDTLNNENISTFNSTKQLKFDCKIEELSSTTISDSSLNRKIPET